MRKLEQTTVNKVLGRAIVWSSCGSMLGVATAVAVFHFWYGAEPGTAMWRNPIWILALLGAIIAAILSLAPAERWNWDELVLWCLLPCIVLSIIGLIAVIWSSIAGEPWHIGWVFLLSACGFLLGGFMGLFRP